MNQPSVVPSNECIFCSHNSRDLEGNVIHMTERHSFFLPDAEYLADLEGMMAYLGEKVGRGLMCVYCNERSRHFQNLASVQRHMADKQHCRLKTDQGSVQQSRLSSQFVFQCCNLQQQLNIQKMYNFIAICI